MAKNTRPQAGYGDLNQIQKPDMTSGFDPQNTSFLGTLLKQATNNFEFDAFKGLSNLFGIVLRVDGSTNKSGTAPLSFFSFGETAALLQLKVRIPELHAHLPEPDLFGNTPTGPHQQIIDLYPTFVAVSEEVSWDIPAVGDIVRVDFSDRTNQTQPQYLGKYATGPGGAGEKNSNPFGIYTGKTEAGKNAFAASNGLNGLGPEGCGEPGNRGNNGYPAPKACKPGTGVFSSKGGNAPTMKSSTPTGNKILDRATVMSSRIKTASGVDVPIQLLMAFIMVESNGRTATRTLVRFEPHCFLGATRKRSWARPDLKNKIPYTPRGTNPAPYISKTRTETNRAAFDRAYKFDPTAAIRSTSFGAYQVMGTWLLKLFDNNPEKAIAAYDKDPNRASDDMAVLWWANELKRSRFKKAIAAQPHDFVTIARHYNGSGQKEKYGAKLKKYFEKFNGSVAATVTSPPPTTCTPTVAQAATSAPAATATATSAVTVAPTATSAVTVSPTATSAAATAPTANSAYTYWTDLVAKAGGQMGDGTGTIDTSIPTVVGVRGITYDSGGNFERHDRSYQRSRNRGKDKGYKDFFIVIKDGAISGPFPGNTRPSFGFGKFGVDANKDGTRDVGMLRPGTYKACWEGPHKKYGVTTWRVSRKDTGEQREMKNGKLIWSGARQRGKGWNLSDTWRDTGNNQSYVWTADERSSAEARGDLSTAVLFHNGTKNNPNSAGCQTMFTPIFQNFQSQVGDTSFWYTLIADIETPIGDPII